MTMMSSGQKRNRLFVHQEVRRLQSYSSLHLLSTFNSLMRYASSARKTGCGRPEACTYNVMSPQVNYEHFSCHSLEEVG